MSKINPSCLRGTAYRLSLMVLAGNAFTIFVAGFVLVLRRHKPGSEKTPVFFTSVVAIAARLFSTCAHWDFFSSQAVASCSAMALFPMAFFAAPFMPFIGAMVIREGDARAEMTPETKVWP